MCKVGVPRLRLDLGFLDPCSIKIPLRRVEMAHFAI
jgi:hypothetical protein